MIKEQDRSLDLFSKKEMNLSVWTAQSRSKQKTNVKEMNEERGKKYWGGGEQLSAKVKKGQAK